MFTDNRTAGDNESLYLRSPYLVSISEPVRPLKGHLSLGTSRAPDGQEIAIDSVSLFRNQERWLPAMGEFHFSRYPREEWRDELLKMKAGGIAIVSSYVFWIHHEEIEGVFDWHGRRSLHDFVALCGEQGMLAVVRCGPWCHGEVKNGGLPDWVLARCSKPRSDDPLYLTYARRHFREIACQLNGLLWKDGGPVIGIQCENEYHGPPDHLLTLKGIAQTAGIDVPLYTRTGWPDLAGIPALQGEMVPLFGGYPDGFWDRSTDEMPAGYRDNYLFGPTCGPPLEVTDQEGMRGPASGEGRRLYPFLSCEIGAGMMTSYHRRVRILPGDIEALALAKIGSGNNLQGYYMFHGGTNPQGCLGTLQESQASGYWNDLPVKTYDYQAPLGEFGQVRPHYHGLRRLHLFLQDFGSDLAVMPVHLPEDRPKRANDLSRLRWAVRSDGHSGFVFVNHHQRLQPLPQKQDVQFDLRLDGDRVCFPREPITVPSGCSFVWPFNLDLAGARIVWASAQPICRLMVGNSSYIFFAETAGVPVEFMIDSATATIERTTGTVSFDREGILVSQCRPGSNAAVALRTRGGERVCIVLLDHAQSLACWKGEYLGMERVFLAKATLLLENDRLRLQSSDPSHMSVAIFPPPDGLSSGLPVDQTDDGIFRRYSLNADFHEPCRPSAELVQRAGDARPVRIGGQGVAEAPGDELFDQAGVWRIALPRLDSVRGLLLRIHYVGDVARLYLNGTLLVDNFYNGNWFEVGLDRYLPAIEQGDLLLKILPLRSDAPIYLPKDAWPDFHGAQSIAELLDIELVRTCEAALAPESDRVRSTEYHAGVA